MDRSMRSTLRKKMEGGRSSSVLPFVAIISSAEEMLARGEEMSYSWHGRKQLVLPESVGALLYPLGLMIFECSLGLPDASICISA